MLSMKNIPLESDERVVKWSKFDLTIEYLLILWHNTGCFLLL